jgi:hypothetical protein
VYIQEPERIHPDLLAAVQKIDVQVAFTMATETTNVIFSSLQPHQTELILPDGSHLQIIDSIADIARSASSAIKKFQYAALLRQEQLVLVWHDDLDRVIQHSGEISRKMLALVRSLSPDPLEEMKADRETIRHQIWGASSQLFAAPTPARTIYSSAMSSPNVSTFHLPMDQKQETEADVLDIDPNTDEESMSSKESLDRPLIVISAISTGLAVLLNTVLLIGFNTSNLTWEVWRMETWYASLL